MLASFGNEMRPKRYRYVSETSIRSDTQYVGKWKYFEIETTPDLDSNCFEITVIEEGEVIQLYF